MKVRERVTYKMKISIYATVSIVAIALMLSLAIMPGEVSAPPATTGPTIFIDNLVYRPTAPLVSPYILPAVTGPNIARTLYVKIARGPQENHEPGLPTDKTFSWGFTLTYDTTVWKVANLGTDVTEEPLTVTTAAQFLKRRVYACDFDGSITGVPGVWYLNGFYTTSFAKGEATLGTLTVGGTLLAPSPAATPLPIEYFDPAFGPNAPDAGRQMGEFYDLPYTLNASQVKPQDDGSSVTDPAYSLLAIIKFTSVAAPPPGYAGSAFHLSDIILLQADTTSNYFASALGTTMDAYYVKVPAAPEFPFGLGVIMMIAPAVALMYLWRTRKKVTKP